MFKQPKTKRLLLLLLISLSLRPLLSQDDGSSEEPANPYCVKGCLRCNPGSKICDICDTSNGYIPTLNKKGCEPTSEENCVLLGKHIFPIIKYAESFIFLNIFQVLREIF